MSQTFAQRTSTTPDYEAEINPAAAGTVSPEPIPEGVRTWLPALVVLIAMPLLALATTTYVLLPSIRQAIAPSSSWTGPSAANEGATRPVLAVIPLNPSGIRRITLVGNDSAFKDTVNQNKAKLTQLAAADLDGLTPSELYKPFLLKATRARLLNDFNHALSGSPVKEVYIGVWPGK